MEHAKNPHNHGKLEGDVRSISLLNPLCGDEINLCVDVQGGTVRDIKFEGQGCFISQASASLLTESVKGKPLGEVRQMLELFRALMHGTEVVEAQEKLGELLALEGVKKFPMRIKCALLAFEALEKATREQPPAGAKPAAEV